MSPAPHDLFRLPVRALAWCGVLGLAVLSLPDRSATRMYGTPWIWLLAGLAALPPVLLLLRLGARGREFRLPTAPWLVATAIAGLGPVASALASPYRAPSLLAAGLPLAAACLVLLLCDWLQTDEARHRPRLEMVVTAGAAIIALGSLGHWLRGFPEFSQSRLFSAELFFARNPHPLGHANYTAGLMLFALPWLAWTAWRNHGWRRIATAGIAGVALLNLFMSGSRGGLLGLVALAVAAPAMRRPGWKRFLLVATCALALPLLLAVTNPRIRALLRPPDPAAAPNVSTVQRTAMFQAGMRMGTDRPLLGWGPGTTPLAYPRYRHMLAGGAENVLQLHSLPLHLWAETGATGLLSVAAFAGLAAFRWRRSPVAAASLAGYGMFALTDYQLDVPVFAAAVAATLALLAPPAPRAASAATRLGIGLTTLAAAGIIALLGARDPAPAMNCEALRLARDPAQHARAVALLEESLALNPDQEIAHFNLGWLLVVPEPAKAEVHFRAAAQLVPDKGGVYFGLGLARLNQDDRTGAARALALECINDPLFLASPWWTVPEIAVLKPDAVNQFAKLLDRAYPPINSLATWPERQAYLLKTLAPQLGQVSPGPEYSYRRERIGYPVLMRNADLPIPLDLYDVREDPRFPASEPFPLPSKGWLPSPLLLMLLADSAP